MHSRTMRQSLPLTLMAGMLLVAGNRVGYSRDKVNFSRQIRPILSENCFYCHGPDANERQADLRLDDETSAHAALKIGSASESELFRRITSPDPDELMPPPDSQRKLTQRQRELIRQWINEGAEWGEHWAFTPLTGPQLPDVTVEANRLRQSGDAYGDWSRQAIDRLVLDKLKQKGITPSPRASRSTLIRRVSLDLLGLPPTPEEIAAFVNDPADDAYEKMVDRLLDSPHYGERMAWDWLDAARYADTNGYQGDRERTMWPWRDWVMQSFNENMPFDQFTVWQLGGDLLKDATDEQKLATAFCRNHMINGEGGRIPEENRVDYVMDMAETTGTVWLGLTFNCCRCHDHKFDPLTQKDYYSLFAFFNQTPVSGGGGDPQTKPNLPIYTEKQRREIGELAMLRASLNEQLKNLPDEEKADDDQKKQRAEIQKQLEANQNRNKSIVNSVPKVMIMADQEKPRDSFRLDRGLYNKPLDKVTAAVPVSLPGLPEDEPSNRLGLARWLVSDENPLTARVTVNRFWQQVFGIGLVKTAEDFGSQSEIPVHAELLEWLAHDFRSHGWDVKRLMRQIVLSETYCQVSDMTANEYEADPDNRLLARASRFRMPAWMIRDAALSASGLLVARTGGPPVNGYQPAGVWEEATFGKKKYVQEHGESLYRRSLYTFWRRIIAPTMFFDNASRQTCTVTPFRTNTPLHALQTLNSVTYVEASRVLAERALMREGGSDASHIGWIVQRVLGREASPQELAILERGLKRSRDQYGESRTEAERLLKLGESSRDESLDVVEHASWTALCLAVFNLDEALTRH